MSAKGFSVLRSSKFTLGSKTTWKLQDEAAKKKKEEKDMKRPNVRRAVS